MESRRSLSYVAFGLLLVAGGLLAALMARRVVASDLLGVPQGIVRPAIVALPALGLAFLLLGLAGLLPDGSRAGRSFEAASRVLGGLWLFTAFAGIAWMLTWESFGAAGRSPEVTVLGIPFLLGEPARSTAGRLMLGAVAVLLDVLLAAFAVVFVGTRLQSLSRRRRRRP
jgi:hypothetical protein